MEEQRLRPKYMVTKIMPVGEPLPPTMESTDPDNVDSPFVLMPRKDPAAFAALVTYSQSCEPSLAGEIHVWLEKIAKSEPVYGTQGKRNHVAMRLKRLWLALGGS